MGRLTDVGPAGLVPAAWLVTIAAHRSLVTERTLLIALVVMDVLLLAFIVASRGEMTGAVLPIWRRVLVVGFVVTVAGTAGLALDPNQPILTAIGLYGWIALPAVAYVQTGQAHESELYRRLYVAAGILSLAGGVVYALGHLGSVSPGVTILLGLAVVGVGQTVGIVSAALQNS
jgi:hypothetical protein